MYKPLQKEEASHGSHFSKRLLTPENQLPLLSPISFQTNPRPKASPLPFQSGALIQSMLEQSAAAKLPIASASNNTGIPIQMKQEFEEKSGLSFEDVRVHYNSQKPAQLQALAYTKGNQVFIGQGQEKHLRHELGHVVQQKQGVVKPNATINNVSINNDQSLEDMADRGIFPSLNMGVRENTITNSGTYGKSAAHNSDVFQPFQLSSDAIHPPVVQRVKTSGGNSGRVPTFFTYVHGRFNRDDILKSEPQGPHTVAHVYVEECLDRYYWIDLYDEQIRPYSPADIKVIIETDEKFQFANLDRYLADYADLYFQLQTWRDDGTLDAIDKGTLGEQGSTLYDEVYKRLERIMEMHPYGSYGWNRGSPHEITRQEISGKGEGTISFDNYEEKLDKVIDPYAHFTNQKKYLEFLHIRIPPYPVETQEQTAPQKLNLKPILDSRVTIVYDNVIYWVEKVQYWILKLPLDYQRLVKTVAHYLPLNQAQRFLHDLRNKGKEQYRSIANSMPEILRLMKYHSDAFEGERHYETLTTCPKTGMLGYMTLKPASQWQTLGDLLGSLLSKVHVYGVQGKYKVANEFQHWLCRELLVCEESEADDPRDPAESVPDSDEKSNLDKAKKRSLWQALYLARRLNPIEDQNQSPPSAPPQSMSTGTELLLEFRHAMGIENEIRIDNTETNQITTLEGSVPKIFLRNIDGHFAYAAVPIPVPQNQNPSDSNEALIRQRSVWFANNSLINAIYRASKQLEAPPLSEDKIRTIRSAARKARDFLGANRFSIGAIRKVLEIRNSIQIWHNGHLQTLFEGDPTLDPLNISFTKAHYTPLSPSQDSQNQPPSLEIGHSNEFAFFERPDLLNDTLVRAIATAGQQYAGTGIITPTAKQCRDIHRFCNIPVNAPLCHNNRTVDYIRRTLGIHNHICILKKDCSPFRCPGIPEYSPIFVGLWDGFYEALDPQHIDHGVREEMIAYIDLEQSPSRLAECIHDALRCSEDKQEFAIDVQSQCQNKSWEFLNASPYSINVIRSILKVAFNLIVYSGDGSISNFYGDKNSTTITILDTGDYYQLTEVKMGEQVNLDAQEPAPFSAQDDPLLVAILDALANISDKRPPPVHVVDIFLQSCQSQLAPLAATENTLKIIQEVMKIPNPIMVKLSDDSHVGCWGSGDMLSIRQEGNSFCVDWAMPGKQVPETRTISWAIKFVNNNFPAPQPFVDYFIMYQPSLSTTLRASLLRIKYLNDNPGEHHTDNELYLMSTIYSEFCLRISPEKANKQLQEYMDYSSLISLVQRFVDPTDTHSLFDSLNENSILELIDAANISLDVIPYSIKTENDEYNLSFDRASPLWNGEPRKELFDETGKRILHIAKIHWKDAHGEEISQYTPIEGKSRFERSLQSTIQTLFSKSMDEFINMPKTSKTNIPEPDPMIVFAAIDRLWTEFQNATEAPYNMDFKLPIRNNACTTFKTILKLEFLTQADPAIQPLSRVNAHINPAMQALTTGVHLRIESTPPEGTCIVSTGQSSFHGKFKPIPTDYMGDGSFYFRNVGLTIWQAIVSGETDLAVICQDKANDYYLLSASNSDVERPEEVC